MTEILGSHFLILRFGNCIDHATYCSTICFASHPSRSLQPLQCTSNPFLTVELWVTLVDGDASKCRNNLRGRQQLSSPRP